MVNMSAVLFLFVGLILCSAHATTLAIVGEGMTRSPTDGVADLDQVLKCFYNGDELTDVNWIIIRSDGTNEPVVSDDVELPTMKAEDTTVTYRCKMDDTHYADFRVSPEIVDDGILPFRVDKFEKSYAVVEQEDLKIECKISNRSDEINIVRDLVIKWYMYNSTGDEKGYVASVGNCSEEVQAGLHWQEIVVDKSNGEPHINLLDLGDMAGKVLKIEDANRTTDRRAFKCVVYHKDARANCSESAFFVRVRDKYAALWPFIGIVSEVVVICLVIFICERRRASAAKEDNEDDEDDVNGKAMGSSSGNSTVRQRTNNKS